MAHATATLNSLLRGEISAVETYEQALDKLSATKGAADLHRIRQEHQHAADTLRAHVQQQGGKAERGSGAWGMFAKAVEGTAKLFGNDAALKALKEGEEHGVKKYERALADKSLPPDSQSLIASFLLPQTEAHVPVLDRLMAGLVERIAPAEAKRKLDSDPTAMLVCGYDDPDEFDQHHLEGAISLETFKAQASSMAKDRLIIFYCA
jgi:uncharacterized protein (TIGR02284 family)